jgi:hypothetical protein
MSTAQDDDEPTSWADYEDQYYAEVAAEEAGDSAPLRHGLPITLVCDYCGNKQEEAIVEGTGIPDGWFCEECNGPMRPVTVESGAGDSDDDPRPPQLPDTDDVDL